MFHTYHYERVLSLLLSQGYDPDFVGLIPHYSTKATQCETMQCLNLTNTSYLAKKKKKKRTVFASLNILCFVHAVFEEFIECLKKKM